LNPAGDKVENGENKYLSVDWAATAEWPTVAQRESLWLYLRKRKDWRDEGMTELKKRRKGWK